MPQGVLCQEHHTLGNGSWVTDRGCRCRGQVIGLDTNVVVHYLVIERKTPTAIKSNDQ